MAECVYFTINIYGTNTINKPHIYNKQQKLIPQIEAFEQHGPRLNRLIHCKKMNSYPSKQGIMCILCNPRHIDRYVSVDMWSTYRPTIGRYLARYSGRHSADTLTVAYRSTVL